MTIELKLNEPDICKLLKEYYNAKDVKITYEKVMHCYGRLEQEDSELKVIVYIDSDKYQLVEKSK